ncbi:EF-hand domain-containing protein [Nostoc sp. UIC 10607]|uniref:EF-hand domain-containing protein n=1 Tax=Nostoc sp. UIC 10607 TaxID=3045935 RepID=UPI00399F2A8C
MADIEEAVLKDAFNRADQNEDGKIGIPHEVSFSGISPLIELTKSNTFFEMLRKADTDKDNSVTYEELKKAVTDAGFTIVQTLE